jgi:hypothetical protein
VPKCIFCPNPANSNEHIFPDWINGEFPNPTHERWTVTRRVGAMETQWPTWETAYLRCKVVCKRCNETWMCNIERQLKPIILPMIRGVQVRLTPEEQLDLGTWGTLKAFVFETRGGHGPVASDEDRRILKEQGRPPANVRAFLAAHSGGNRFAVLRIRADGYKKDSTELESASATTFVLGHLVVQVLGNPRSDYRAFQGLGVADNRSQSLVPPVAAGRLWPSPQLLDNATLDEFAYANVQVTMPLPPETHPDPERRPAGEPPETPDQPPP